MDNEKQLLRDENIKPTAEIIADALGPVNGVYNKFIEDLKDYSISLMDWRYYNDGKAWLSKGEYKWTTSRGTDKVKPIFWLSIWDEFFKVSFNFTEKTMPQLLSLPISNDTKEMIKNTELMGKTRKFIPVIFDVINETKLDDVYVLAEFRKENI